MGFGSYNTVAIGNSAGLPSNATVFFDGTFSGFAVDSPASGTPVTVTAGNFVINNSSTYSFNSFVVGIGATAGNTLIINGGIIGIGTAAGTGDVQFSTGFSGTLDTDGDLTGNGTGLVILNGQSKYAGQTRFNSGISVTTSGTIQSYVRLGITNALPTTTDLIMSYTTGNGGNFDLYGFNQTVSSISTTVLNSPSVIFNSGGASGTTASTLTVNGSNSLGPFDDAIDDADPGAGVNSSASPGTSAPLTLVRAGTGATILTNVASTYSGGTQILGGVLSINDDRELGSNTNASVPHNVIISGGTLVASGSFALNTGRTVAVGAPGKAAATISVATGSTLTYNGAIADYTGSSTSGTGGIILTGGGTLSLGGLNTYTGPTQVNQGTLSLASGGSLTSSSAVTVGSSGTLTGAGTANGSVTVGGTIAPGSSTQIGQLTVGTLTLSPGGTYHWKIGNSAGSPGTGFDSINVSNPLSVTTPLVLNSTSANPFVINVAAASGGTNFDNTQPDSWVIASTGSAVPAFNSNIFTVNSGLGLPGSSFTVTSGGSLDPSGHDLVLNYNPGTVPLFVWNGGSSNWGSSNWTNNAATVAWTDGGSAEFKTNPGGSSVVTLMAPVSTAGLVFNVGGYTVAGNSTVNTSFASVVNPSDTATITAPVNGSAFQKLGLGTLVPNQCRQYSQRHDHDQR